MSSAVAAPASLSEPTGRAGRKLEGSDDALRRLRRHRRTAPDAGGGVPANLSFLWEKFSVPMPPGVSAGRFEATASGHRYAGDPDGARDWVAEHAATAGISYFSLEFAFGDMTMAEAARSAELFATEVMPWFAQ